MWFRTLQLCGYGGKSDSAPDVDIYANKKKNGSRLAVFFFFIAVFAHWTPARRGRMTFSMTWFSFVFPNTALTTATFAVGKAFNSKGIEVVGYALTVLLFITYFFVFFTMVRAIRTRQILWPQKGEDKDEGGFKIKEHKPDANGVLPTHS